MAFVQISHLQLLSEAQDLVFFYLRLEAYN